MDGMVIHIATRECPITQHHPEMECAVVAARRRCQEEGDSAMRRQHRDEQGQAKRSEEHTSELQSHSDLVCRLLLEKKKKNKKKAPRATLKPTRTPPSNPDVVK